jgi:hypothetical protein
MGRRCGRMCRGRRGLLLLWRRKGGGGSGGWKGGLGLSCALRLGRVVRGKVYCVGHLCRDGDGYGDMPVFQSMG